LDDLNLRIELVAAPVLHALRRRVLRNNNPESSVADARDDESTSLHFGGFDDGRLVVSASFYPSTAPRNPDLVTYQLRFMATDFDVQGRGCGARVLAFAEAELRRRGVEQVWANARDTALGFYQAIGWSIISGGEHLSVETQLPHTVIVKQLRDNGASTS
jgi:GNAT superfamily N-acetyltransferase